MSMASQKQVKVSERAFSILKSMAKNDPIYKGRGVTGVVDKLLFGEFTTEGSGRPFVKRKKKVEESSK